MISARHGVHGQVSRVPAHVSLSVPGENQRPGHHLRERGDQAAQDSHRQHEEVQAEAGLHGMVDRMVLHCPSIITNKFVFH